MENRPVEVGSEAGTGSFVYDGNGNRVKKIEGDETTIYVNKYYEKNLTAGVVTSYYYLGDRMVALKKDTTLRFVHQDHLTGTAVITDTDGNEVGSIKYYPYGETRSTGGTLETDKKFTGQRLDDTGLYYYSARYYDPTIGRFISADTLVPNPANPQAFNRYSYCLNNPLKYTDPSGHQIEWALPLLSIPGVGQIVSGVLIIGGCGVAGYFLSKAIINVFTSSPSFDLGGGVGIGNANQGTTTPLSPPIDTSPPGFTLSEPIYPSIADPYPTLDIPIYTGIPGTRNIPDTTTGTSANINSGEGASEPLNVNEGALSGWSGNYGDPDDEDDWRQWKTLSPGEERSLGQGTAHWLKKGYPRGSNLVKDRQGNLYVKPPGGQSPPEPTGYNICDF